MLTLRRLRSCTASARHAPRRWQRRRRPCIHKGAERRSSWTGSAGITRAALVGSAAATADGEYRRVEFPDGSRLYLGRVGGDESDAAGALVRMLATAYGEE